MYMSYPNCHWVTLARLLLNIIRQRGIKLWHRITKIIIKELNLLSFLKLQIFYLHLRLCWKKLRLCKFEWKFRILVIKVIHISGSRMGNRVLRRWRAFLGQRWREYKVCWQAPAKQVSRSLRYKQQQLLSITRRRFLLSRHGECPLDVIISVISTL